MARMTKPYPPGPITLELTGPEDCPICHGPITGIALQLQEIPAGSAPHGTLPGSTATGLPCQCVIRTSDPRKLPTPRYVEITTIPRPPEDAPRSWHAWYARAAGYFWLPCPVCGEEFGGHEWLPERADLEPTIPDPDDPRRGAAICPPCIRAGHGARAWAQHLSREHAAEPTTEGATDHDE